MHTLLLWTARIAGLLGIALSVAAGLARLAGAFWIAGFQAGTLLLAGIAAMLLACLSYVALLVEGRSGGA